MKTIPILLALATALFAQEERIIVVPGKTQEPPPLFYSTAAIMQVQADLEKTTATQKIVFDIVQGNPEKLTLSLFGEGEVKSVTGDKVKDWSVRVAKDGSRFLDIHPALEAGNKPPLKKLEVSVTTLLETEKETRSLLVPGLPPVFPCACSWSPPPAPNSA